MRVKARLIRKSARIASWMQVRKEILEITRTQQYTDGAAEEQGQKQAWQGRKDQIV